ncbi:MAG TPA: CHASE domain-containing protein [Candidatus Saccharimonadales bacterium]
MGATRRLYARLQSGGSAVYRSLFFPPSVICIAIIIASVFGWQAAKQSLAHDLTTAEDVRIGTAEQSLYSHISSYEQILRGGVGLFQGSDSVTSSDWANYLSAFDVKNNFPGVQGIGFARVFTADQLPDVQAFMADQGVPDFQVTPADPPRDTYAAVVYLQTVAATAPPSFGFDMYSEPTRRAAMEEARDNDQTTITPRIQLMTAGPAQNRPTGFNMYAPYYGPTVPSTVDDRRAQLRGYVYASFRTEVFFRPIIAGLNTKTMAFAINIHGDKTPLYASPNYDRIAGGKDAAHIERSARMYGQTWDIRYALDANQVVSTVQLRRPGGVLFFGIFTAVLISLIIYLVLRGRARDLTAQKERAVEMAKDELLSLASHQLRTPATGVKQYVGMVLQGFVGDISDEQKALLEKAYASNDRQLRIINEILHLAKIDSGRIVLARQTTDLNDLVKDIVTEQRPDIAAAKHHLKLQLSKRPVMANVDTHMLRMALENILSNAIKYTPEGGHIKVQVRRLRLHALIEVTDDGVGINPGDINEIFRQFSRLPNEMSQRVEGTGIGLYLAKHLIELHKGSIRVISKPGQGSTFTIEVPLKIKGL